MSYIKRNHAINQRKASTIDIQPRILIVTEGTVTEPTYFRWLKRHLKISPADIIEVKDSGGSTDPKSIASLAIELFKESLQEGNPYSFVFCTVDRDAHGRTKFFDAKRLIDGANQSHQNQFRLIITYPCIEHWFVLHFANDSHVYLKPMLGRGSIGSDAKRYFKHTYYASYDETDKRQLEKMFNSSFTDINRINAIKFARGQLRDITANGINPLSLMFSLATIIESIARPDFLAKNDIPEFSFQQYTKVIEEFFAEFNRDSTL
ncbi:MAG: RloB family protein [Burkholderiales bacterium]|nr:RloB family protein [Burkholderiales bacterium]